jgi:hypothetical protein
MGKASSSKKVARAAKTGGRAGSSRSYGWPLLVTSVVVVGVLLIVLSRGGNEDAVAPKLGDHWHAAYGIYDCDHFIPNLQDVKQDTTGLHTHGDGLMHMHPFGTQYTGHGANIGNWGDTTGLVVTDTSIKAAGIDEKNGDKCSAKAAKLQLKVWDSPDDTKGRLVDKDFAKWAPQEFSMWVLAFVPEGADIPKPPAENIQNLQAPADVAGASTTAPVSTESTEPGATSSTTAPGSESTTSTTAPATTTTAAP